MIPPDEWLPNAPGADPSPEQAAIEVIFGDSIDRADIPGLCETARDRLAAAADADRLICDVGSILVPDAVTVDALARLQLTARRLGRQMCLRNASGELLDLVYLMGLNDTVTAVDPQSGGGRGRRQAEEGEQGGGVEEERNAADATA